MSVTLGSRTVLDRLTAGVSEGDRIGVVGPNGSGKSTLAAVLTGEREPDAGRAVRAGGVSTALVAQHDRLPSHATVRHVLVGTAADHAWRGEPAVRAVMVGLLGGLDAPLLPGGLAATVGRLSGGERRRVALAAALIAGPDLLVLDEPTNHLDVEAITWLADHLAGRPSALVAVTHDRWFLDRVSTGTWEVADGQVQAYEGGYAAYVLARAERARLAATTEARRQNLLRKELAWLRRGPPARTSKPRFRIDAANALIADEPAPREHAELVRFATARLGRTVLDLEDVSLRAGDTVVLDHVTWRLGPGDRVGVVGVNGSGKTTLLRLLAGERDADAGRVVRGLTVKPAHLSQELTELDPALSVLGAVEDVAQRVDLGKGRELTASQLAERIGFSPSRQRTRVGDLSGGERRRLQLVRLLAAGPNVLLLDEPTNDLDVDTLTALEDLLDGFPGTLVVVSHDRYFLERVTDAVYALLGEGRLAMLPGGVEEYLARRREGVAAPRAAARDARAAGAAGGAGAAVGESAAGAEGAAVAGAPGQAQVRAARKEMARWERALDRLNRQEADLHERLAQEAADYAAVTRLDGQLRALVAQRDDAEQAWLTAAEVAQG